MPHCFIKQPDGKYAIWSTVVDAFIDLGMIAAEALATEMENDKHKGEYPGGPEQLEKDLRREIGNIEIDGYAWKWAPNWAEALHTVVAHNDEHGVLKDLFEMGLTTQAEIDTITAEVKAEEARDDAERERLSPPA